MSECNHDCSGCSSKGNCSSEIKKAQLGEGSHVKKTIAVLSGKGGVGKSYVTSLIASSLAKKGFKVGILDGDITGPSIPKAFGIHERAMGDGNVIYPIRSANLGIKVMSSNLLLENESDPIIWRGSLLCNLVKQFYENVLWEELDYLVIDMPPGTADITLSVFQLIPLDDIIVVTSPQDLVSLIVAKALKMADMMNIHVLGVVENMSYLACPDCGKHIPVFGESHIDEFAKDMNFRVLAKLPLNNENTKLVDEGRVEEVELPEIEECVETIIKEG